MFGNMSAIVLMAMTVTQSDDVCRAIPPAPTASAEARVAMESDADLRFLDTAPITVADFKALQSASREAGEQWVADRIEEGLVEVAWTEMGGVPAAWTKPAGAIVAPDDLVVFNLHGGGYALNGGAAALYSAVSLASERGIASVSVDYRLTPQHAYPAALDDAVNAYRALIATRSPDTIAVYGLSAGGGLGASFLLRLRNEGLPMPRAAVLNSPWSDIAMESDTLVTNDCHDLLLGRSTTSLRRMADFYAKDVDRRDPILSPVHANWKGIDVPVLLISGTRDIMLSDTVRLHEAMWRVKVPAELLVYEGMWHAFSVGSEFSRMLQDSVDFMQNRSKYGGKL